MNKMDKIQLTDIPAAEHTNLMRNPELVRQGYDYNGFENGVIHPSDADVEWEFDNTFYILGEIKYKGNPIPEGQDWLIRRKIDAWMDGNRVVKEYNEKLYWQMKYMEKAGIKFDPMKFIKEKEPGRKAIAYKLVHETPKDNKFVMVKDCRVEKFYENGSWQTYHRDEAFIDTFQRLGHEWGVNKIIKTL